MAKIKPRADNRGEIIDPQTYLLIRLLSGAKFVAHLCSEKPRDRRDIGRVSLGVGVVTSSGGKFRATRSGRIECIAYVMEGRIFTSRPSLVEQHIREGQIANVGPVTTPAR